MIFESAWPRTAATRTKRDVFSKSTTWEAAFDQLKSNGLDRDEPGYRIDTHGPNTFRVFFVVAPDGLCYCIGQKVHPPAAKPAESKL